MLRFVIVVAAWAVVLGEEGFCSVDDQFQAIRDRVAALEEKLEEKPEPKYKCYVWTTADLDAMPTIRTPEIEEAQCEGHVGNVYTHGDNANYTGCGECNCCAYIVKVYPQYECYSWNTKDSTYIHAAYSVAREKERCESYPNKVFTQGVNDNYPGCGKCWCCTKVTASDFVGFTSYLSKWVYDLPDGQPIVLDKVIVNQGNGYDTATGKFTAPVSGYYFFTLSVETRAEAATSVVVRLVVDGVNMLNVVTEPWHQGQNLSGSNAGVLKLQKGQAVWIEPYQVLGQDIEGGDGYRFTTFAGALLAKL